MTIDTFRPHELVDIAGLATVVEKFNREQVGDHPLFAEVVLYRAGEDVALITTPVLSVKHRPDRSPSR